MTIKIPDNETKQQDYYCKCKKKENCFRILILGFFPRGQACHALLDQHCGNTRFSKVKLFGKIHADRARPEIEFNF